MPIPNPEEVVAVGKLSYLRQLQMTHFLTLSATRVATVNEPGSVGSEVDPCGKD